MAKTFSEERFNELRQLVEDSELSLNKLAEQTGVSRRSLQRIAAARSYKEYKLDRRAEDRKYKAYVAKKNKPADGVCELDKIVAESHYDGRQPDACWLSNEAAMEEERYAQDMIAKSKRNVVTLLIVAGVVLLLAGLIVAVMVWLA